MNEEASEYNIWLQNINKEVEDNIEMSKKLYNELQIKTKIFFTVSTILFIGYMLWM